MAKSRNAHPRKGWCSAFTQGISNSFTAVVNTFTLRPGERKLFFLSTAACIGSAAVFSAPSVAYAVWTNSTLPLYALRGAYTGVGLALAALSYKRMTRSEKPKAEIAAKEKAANEKGYVALVKLNGPVGSGCQFSQAKAQPLLKKAFEDEKAKGVVILMNSPGGSPVQASLIHNEIIRLKKEHKKTVIVVAEDTLASAAYYVAVSAHKIYVNANSYVGSIGVVTEGYGCADLAKKLGIEHRVHTAGVNKRRLDPFLPEKAEDVKKLNQELEAIHKEFIDTVKTDRGSRLKNKKRHGLFTGDGWMGRRALELGLVDGIGDLPEVIKTEFQVERFKEVKTDESLFSFFRSGEPAASVNVNVSLTDFPALKLS